jgi:predicted nucleic acid-binding protein
LPNAEFEDDANSVLDLFPIHDIPVYICANSLTDIFYFLKKVHKLGRAKQEIADLIKSYNIIPITAEDCISAISLDMDDFEDAIIAVCAEKAGADYIISRDKAFLESGSPIPIITPGVFLKNYLKVLT